MGDYPKFSDMALQSATRAVNLEGVSNIAFACLRQVGTKDFEIEYGFYNNPTDGDLESISLIETEIVSDIWNWVGSIRYTWSVLSRPPKETETDGNIVFYISSKIDQ